MNYVKVKNNSLKNLNTLRINSVAELIIYPLNYNGVQDIFHEYREKNIIIIGNGSNILFTKEYYDNNYLFISFKLMDFIGLVNNQIVCDAGVSLSSLSWYALENRIKGYEFLEDIPGSLGGAVIMNAGTYEDNIGQLIEEVTHYNIDKDEIITENVDKSDFGRRESKWADINSIILSVKLRAKEEYIVEDYQDLLEDLFAIKKNRYNKQPRDFPNAGSVFKRPNLNGKDYFIWKLFDELGLRGYRKNGAMISEKHPGFIINYDDAKPQDILYIINLATEQVKENFGIELELEWKLV
ncbi:UDP-N-acetylmuramate dehydrogenase [Gracilibacillus oryzae]|uniref:UDP-N-acetylenolpyruvoylglucosamine reductase n=1 Tax=Gracilibacillus oryzae TaxID=1672701 RepID=A0A7C8KTK6_9BACI|nr:UDP-N-acetylmuramate dehydrogenase [Gracilibacillus oryzae]KAB8133667.1 UDP-N-acetylmuramate dehydrogenase [Gracilibacillus oryzae]